MNTNIGQVSKNANGILVGSIATLTMAMTIRLEPVNSPKPNTPEFEIYARAPNGSAVKVGALWQKKSSGGTDYLNGALDDPSFPETVYVSAFYQDDGSINFAWSRPVARRSNNGFSDTSVGSDNSFDQPSQYGPSDDYSSDFETADGSYTG